jgi:exonuclease SbcC
MMPQRISMQAFGPYAGHQAVDFGPFQAKHLFLIHGKTGSGKTTLFDAMCYALYGRTSGDLRVGDEMRSHHAKDDMQTQVEFDFSIGARHFRVRRVPAQSRQKTRGPSMTKVQQKAELYERTTDEKNDGRLLATGHRDVEEQVQQIIGCDVSQFRQVIVIPQGDFRKLLTVGSDEREKILETLFSTTKYRTIQEQLKTIANQMKADCKEQLTRRSTLLESEECGNPEELSTLIEEKNKEVTALEKNVVTQKKALDAQSKVLTAAQKDEQQFVELEKAKQEEKELKKEKAGIDKERTSAAAAKKAAAVTDVYTQHHEKVQERKSVEQQLVESRKEETRAVSASKAAKLEEVTARKKQPQQKELEKECHQLQLMLPKVKDLEKLTTKLTQNRQAVKKHKDQLVDAELREQRLDKAITKNDGMLENTKALAAQLEASQLALKNGKEQVKDQEKIAGTRKDHTTATKKEAAAAKAMAAKEKALEKSKAEQDEIEKHWQESIATNLAASLTPGEPCAVCGSTDHPHPALPKPGTSVVDDSELQEARERVEQAEEKFNDAREDHRSWVTKKNTLENRLSDLTDDNIEAKSIDIKKLGKRVDDAKQSKKELTSFETMKKNQTAKKQDLKEEIKGIRKDLGKSENEKAGTTKAIETASKGIPKNFLDATKLTEAIEKKQTRAERIADEIDKRTETSREAEKTSTKAKTRTAADTRAVTTAKKAEETSNNRLKTRLAKKGFDDVDAYSKALMDEKNLLETEKDIKEYDNRCAANSERVTRGGKAVESLKRPDIDKLADARDTAEDGHTTAVKVHATGSTLLKQLKKTSAEVKAIEKEVARQEKKAAAYTRVSEVANGSNERRITLQRYVLTTILDDVVRAATVRLSRMSSGRYLLQRSEGGEDRRRAAGLELDVFDDHTGSTRSVRTLSGGEMFLASLSMALGLVDVVQDFAGGVRIDSMFIDEGFGTLDTDTLEQALATLVNLKPEGRMLGVISHVGELRERIDARLEIVSKKKGSAIEVHV